MRMSRWYASCLMDPMADEPPDIPDSDRKTSGVSRRRFIQSAATAAGASLLPVALGDAETPAGPGPAAESPSAGAAGTSVRHSVRLNVNRSVHKLALEPRVTLLDALREQLGFVGTKKGCDRGQCGACTVLVNERRVNSCLSFAGMHERDVIVTVEGLGTANGGLHPLQQAFIEHDAFQCGFCMPRQICSAVACSTSMDKAARAKAPCRTRRFASACAAISAAAARIPTSSPRSGLWRRDGSAVNERVFLFAGVERRRSSAAFGSCATANSRRILSSRLAIRCFRKRCLPAPHRSCAIWPWSAGIYCSEPAAITSMTPDSTAVTSASRGPGAAVSRSRVHGVCAGSRSASFIACRARRPSATRISAGTS